MSNVFLKRILSTFFLLPITFFFIIEGLFFFNFLLLFCFFFSIKEWRYICGKSNFYYFGILFFFTSFSSAFFLRNLSNDGLFLFLFVIIVSISTDLGGYFFGKLFKGPKLTKISPNKTYSGVFGSFILSLIITYSYIKIFNIFLYKDYIFYYKTFYFILFLSTISQIGDLIISFFKRKSNLKDSGNLIPGHGGILDRIDGMLFSIPSFYFSLKFINFI